MRFVNSGGDGGEFVGRCGCRESWGGVHERTAMLRNSESGHYLRDASLVHLSLSFSYPIEGKPADETRGDRQEYRSTDTNIELRGDSKAPFEKSLEGREHNPRNNRKSPIP